MNRFSVFVCRFSLYLTLFAKCTIVIFSIFVAHFPCITHVVCNEKKKKQIKEIKGNFVLRSHSLTVLVFFIQVNRNLLHFDSCSKVFSFSFHGIVLKYIYGVTSIAISYGIFISAFLWIKQTLCRLLASCLRYNSLNENENENVNIIVQAKSKLDIAA